MNLNQRRPTGSGSSVTMPVTTKSDFISFLECDDISVEENHDNGKHNFYASLDGEKIWAGSFGKGETRDWQNMYDYVLGEFKE